MSTYCKGCGQRMTSAPSHSDHEPACVRSKLATEIVDAIVDDIGARHALAITWDDLEADVQHDAKMAWERIVKLALERGGK